MTFQFLFICKSLIHSLFCILVLQKIDTDTLIYDLRKKIQQIKTDLKELGEPVPEIPELITSTNLLRSNEYLVKTNDKKTELLSAYEQYSTALEDLLSIVFEIQYELKEILKDQSLMISSTSKKHKKTTTKLKSRKK